MNTKRNLLTGCLTRSLPGQQQNDALLQSFTNTITLATLRSNATIKQHAKPTSYILPHFPQFSDALSKPGRQQNRWLSLLLLLFMTLFNPSVFAQWERVSPSGEFLYAQQKLLNPENTDFYYSLGVQMVTSADGGLTWNIAPENGLINQEDLLPGNIAYDISFPGINTGYLVKENKIYKTTDGNLSWALQLELDPRNNFSDSPDFHAIDFVDDNTGFAVGTYDKIFKTTDGGITWNELRWTASSAPYISYTDVTFINPLVGFVTGYEAPSRPTNFGFSYIIQKTIDGGNTWTTFRQDFAQDHRVVELQMIDQDVGYLSLKRAQLAGDRLFRTGDGGQTWDEVTIPLRFRKTAMWWVTADRGFIIGNENNVTDGNVLLTTTDGGGQWETSFSGEGHSLENMVFSTAQNGVITGTGGELFSTQDGGVTWEAKFEATTQFRAADAGKNELFALSEAGLVRSQDRGVSWSLVNHSALFDLFTHLKLMPGGQMVFMPFFFGIVHLSADTGKTVAPVSPQLINSGPDPLAVAGNKIFYTGSETSSEELFLSVSDDLGTTWNEYPVGTTEGTMSLSVINDDTIFVSTPVSIYRTTNGGEGWEVMHTTETGQFISKSYFVNEHVGFIIINQTEQILRTTNGGATWEAINFQIEKDVFAQEFFFVNNNVGYMCGSSKELDEVVYTATIWRTTDAGKNWEEDDVPDGIFTFISDMVLLDADLYAIGSFGHVLRKSLSPPFESTPVVINPLADITREEGFQRDTLDLTGVFSDPDGDVLSLSATSDDQGVAIATVLGNTLILTEQSTGTAQITVTAANDAGETADDTFDFTVNAGATITSIDDQPYQERGISIFPNPLQDVLNIRADFFKHDIPSFGLADATGKQLPLSLRRKSDDLYVLSTDNLNPGIYLLQITFAGQRIVKRILKL